MCIYIFSLNRNRANNFSFVKIVNAYNTSTYSIRSFVCLFVLSALKRKIREKQWKKKTEKLNVTVWRYVNTRVLTLKVGNVYYNSPACIPCYYIIKLKCLKLFSEKSRRICAYSFFSLSLSLTICVRCFSSLNKVIIKNWCNFTKIHLSIMFAKMISA